MLINNSSTLNGTVRFSSVNLHFTLCLGPTLAPFSFRTGLFRRNIFIGDNFSHLFGFVMGSVGIREPRNLFGMDDVGVRGGGRGRGRGGRGRGRGRGRGGVGRGRGRSTTTDAAWKSPLEKAAELSEGEVRLGLDGQSKWKVVCLRSSGLHRWCRIEPKPFTSKSGVARVDPEQLFSRAHNAEEILNAAFDDADQDFSETHETKAALPFVLGRTKPKTNINPNTLPNTSSRLNGDNKSIPPVGWQRPGLGISFAGFGSHDPPPPSAQTAGKAAASRKAPRATSAFSQCDMEIEENIPVNTRAQSKNTNVGFRWNAYNDPNNIFSV
jgi:hypothetical protein